MTALPRLTRAQGNALRAVWFVIGYDAANAIRHAADGKTGWALVSLSGAVLMYCGYRMVRGLA